MEGTNGNGIIKIDPADIAVLKALIADRQQSQANIDRFLYRCLQGLRLDGEFNFSDAEMAFVPIAPVVKVAE